MIEGVMMRSRDAYSVAVRRQDGSILVRVRPFVSFVRRSKILSLPILRGAVVLLESLVLGVKALTFSGDVASEDMKSQEESASETNHSGDKEKGLLAKLWLGMTVLFSFAIGLFIFFYIPLLLTDFFGFETGFMFNLVDGFFRLLIFLIYLSAISLIKDIRRIFEYHGAEHKSIFAFENKQPLSAASAQAQTRFHPRCGTSFLLIVMIVSIFVFMFLGKPLDLGDRLLRLAFIPLIGGLSYEFIRLSDAGANNRFWRLFILPGLWLQKLTTKEPDAGQLDVALVALKCALNLDVSDHPGVVFESDAPMPVAQSEVAH